MVIIIMILIVSFWAMFLSYNFIYDFAYLKNFRNIENYKIVQNNEKLFTNYFENTTWKFNQLYGFIPTGLNLYLWNHTFSWLTTYFTGYIFLNDDKIYVKSGDFLNYSGTYDITLKNNLGDWQYFFIEGLTWNFSCVSWVYEQKLWYGDFKRNYILFTSTGMALDLLSWDYDGGGKKNDIKFSWSFSWNKNVLDKYYFDIFSWDDLLTWQLNGGQYCSGLDCVWTWYDFDTGDYNFEIETYFTGILQDCGKLQTTWSISIQE